MPPSGQPGVGVGVWHAPCGLQVEPVGQAPQLAPQPSSPQDLPLQPATQAAMQLPPLQLAPVGQAPQLAPQPSSPQSLPPQSATQAATMHVPPLQLAPAGQAPQLAPQPSSPHCFPVQAGTHAGADGPDGPGPHAQSRTLAANGSRVENRRRLCVARMVSLNASRIPCTGLDLQRRCDEVGLKVVSCAGALAARDKLGVGSRLTPIVRRLLLRGLPGARVLQLEWLTESTAHRLQ
jgi:hypothetical protein